MKVNESNECELVTADSQGTERAPWKEELLQALQNLFTGEISICKVSRCHQASLTQFIC